VQLVLVRLLAPEQFGLIAMVVVFISISSVLIDAGFSRALIQRKEVSDSDLSTVFYFNLGAAALIAALLYVSAPSIAAFYDQSELSIILRFLCLGLLISAFGTVHQAILMRDLLFKKRFWVSFPSTVISGIVGAVLAFRGYGVWPLVAQVLCQRTIATPFLWFHTGWRPMHVFDLNTLKEMSPYGVRLAASAVLDQGFQNIYLLVIGKFFPPAQVRFFQRARSFQQLTVQNFQVIFSRVAFPLFASIQNDPIRMKRGMRQAVQVTCLFVFSGMALLAAIVEPMIEIAFY
jgi:teichuronic acid exporter